MSKIHIKNNQTGISILYNKKDGTTTMKALREFLSEGHKGFMNENDEFLSEGSTITKKEEGDWTIDAFLGDSTTITVGQQIVDLDPNVKTFKELTDLEKGQLLDGINVYNGITSDKDGFHKSGINLVTWSFNHKDFHVLRPETHVSDSSKSFNKVSQSLSETNTHGGSMSISAPFGGTEAEFNYSKTKDTASTKVTEYLYAYYNFQKVTLMIPTDSIILDEKFITELRGKVEEYIDDPNHPDAIKSCCHLIETLNKWGYYVPNKITLGGSVHSSEKSEASSYDEAITVESDFSAGFNAAFDGISGEGKYKESHKKKQEFHSESSFKHIKLRRRGGSTDGDINTWEASLKSLDQWDVAAYDEMVPVIGLLFKVDADLAAGCVALIRKWYSYKSVAELQSSIEMMGYANEAQKYQEVADYWD